MTRCLKGLRSAAMLILASATASLAEPALAPPAAQTLKEHTKTAQDLVDIFVKAIAKADWVGAHAVLAPEVQTKIPLGQFSKSYDSLHRSGMKSVTWGKSLLKRYGNDQITAELDAVVTTIGAGLVDVSIEAINRGGIWRILFFKFKSRPGTVPTAPGPAGK